MIEKLKNDDLSILCGIQDFQKKILINEFKNRFNAYYFENKETEINKEKLITESKYIIINYPVEPTSETIQKLENYALENNKKIIMFSKLPKA